MKRDHSSQNQANSPFFEDSTVEKKLVAPGDVAPTGHPAEHPETGNLAVELFQPGVGGEREGIAQEEDRFFVATVGLQTFNPVRLVVDPDRPEFGSGKFDRPDR